jgi:hypothetical protein
MPYATTELARMCLGNIISLQLVPRGAYPEKSPDRSFLAFGTRVTKPRSRTALGLNVLDE